MVLHIVQAAIHILADCKLVHFRNCEHTWKLGTKQKPSRKAQRKLVSSFKGSFVQDLGLIHHALVSGTPHTDTVRQRRVHSRVVDNPEDLSWEKTQPLNYTSAARYGATNTNNVLIPTDMLVQHQTQTLDRGTRFDRHASGHF